MSEVVDKIKKCFGKTIKAIIPSNDGERFLFVFDDNKSFLVGIKSYGLDNYLDCEFIQSTSYINIFSFDKLDLIDSGLFTGDEIESICRQKYETEAAEKLEAERELYERLKLKFEGDK